MQTWFHTRSLHPGDVLLCALAGLVVLLLLELEKWALRLRKAG